MKFQTVGWFFALGAAAAFSLAPSPAQAEREAGLQVHSASGDETYFALFLRADELEPSETPRQHVVLIDTSASQVGEHRQQSLAVLRALIESLPAGDRVKLFAVDVAAERLTDSFVAPQDSRIEQALGALNLRVPLGATDLALALQTAVDAIPANSAGSIVYIGDGMSTADLIAADTLRQLVAELRDRRLPVHSYAVGPRKDLRLLGTLGHQTGGYVLFDAGDGDADRPATVGRKLASAATRPVLYPEEIRVESQDGGSSVAVLPNVPLPVRSDRETILLGRGALGAGATVTAFTGQRAWRWQVGQPVERPGNSMLAALWSVAVADGGLSDSLAGRELFALARTQYAAGVSNLLDVGEDALAGLNFAKAAEFGQAVAQADPGNLEAEALLAAARHDQALLVAQNAPPEPPPADSLIDDAVGAQQQEGLIPELQELIRVRTQKLQQEVSQAIQTARAADDLEAAEDLLKRTLTAVRAAADVNLEVRGQLQTRLERELLDLANTRDIAERARIRFQESQAQLEQQQRLVEQLQLDEERLEQLIDRVRALLDEGRHGDDQAFDEAKVVARVAVDLEPGEGTAAVAFFGAEAALQLNRTFRLRARRNDRFLETLHLVELSHVPFPDEPPIRFPTAQVWQALTERREKYESVDLKRHSPNEERIRAELSQTTDIEFLDTPLRDALDFIEELHRIEIWIDEQAITDEGVATDEPISLTLSGVTLRSALRLMLEPLALTYIIEDEVMKITTQVAAEEKLSTRVYPVADLVIPIITPQAGGLGQGLGGVGGLGGGGLGGAGQFGGGGGGGFGGGGFGGGGFGGGGLFSLPPENVQPATNGKKKRELNR